MNTSDYEKAALQQLTNTEFYKEIAEDQTMQCRKTVDELAAELHDSGFTNEFENDTLRKGERTSQYYGLPKIHKDYDTFPALRGICSGSDSPTVRLSEFVDTFLKPIAVKTLSYIRDTTDFINKTRNITVKEGSTLVTMDVISLYPNIDQDEGAEACEHALNNRSHPTIPTSLIKRMIQTILQSNIMQFGSRYFQQIKGTAMGTPMAVHFANIFMDKFERDMLNAYEQQHGMRPAIWFRFIDDIFFVWEGNELSLNNFIKFCDSYSSSCNMKSSIRFTSSCSKEEVNFLDMTVKLHNGHLVTDLFTKSVDTHTYLHAKSFHPPSTVSALPKAQFIRIRRICSSITDYQRHATKFVNFFSERGFKRENVRKIAAEIESTDRDSLLLPQNIRNRIMTDDARVVLSVKWHPRLRFLPKLMHSMYERFTSDHPNIKTTFSQPPIVAFRKNKTIKDILVHAKTTSNASTTHTNRDSPSARFTLSTSSTLINIHSGVTVNTMNNECTIHESNVVYAAECTKCHMLYVGQTKQKTFERFVGHRSDTAQRPERCELPQHFADPSTDCNFNSDLRIHILQRNVTGPRCIREAEEDKWIMKLGTLSPLGMNAKLSDYGCLYKTLF